MPTLATALLTVLVTDPATGLATVLLAGPVTVLLTGPLTALLTLARTPPAGEAGDCFGLALDAVPGVVPVLWSLPWPGMTSWVTAWTAEATALVAAGAGDCPASSLDPAGGGAGTLAAGAFAAGMAGTFAAGSAAGVEGRHWRCGCLAGRTWLARGARLGRLLRA